LSIHPPGNRQHGGADNSSFQAILLGKSGALSPRQAVEVSLSGPSPPLQILQNVHTEFVAHIRVQSNLFTAPAV
jgi:hypothetical protein